jgi:hypothetical protein
MAEIGVFFHRSARKREEISQVAATSFLGGQSGFAVW